MSHESYLRPGDLRRYLVRELIDVRTLVDRIGQGDAIQVDGKPLLSTEGNDHITSVPVKPQFGTDGCPALPHPLHQFDGLAKIYELHVDFGELDLIVFGELRAATSDLTPAVGRKGCIERTLVTLGAVEGLDRLPEPDDYKMGHYGVSSQCRPDGQPRRSTRSIRPLTWRAIDSRSLFQFSSTARGAANVRHLGPRDDAFDVRG